VLQEYLTICVLAPQMVRD